MILRPQVGLRLKPVRDDLLEVRSSRDSRFSKCKLAASRACTYWASLATPQEP
jgi:hypothetical protein